MDENLRKREINGGQVLEVPEEGYNLVIPQLPEGKYGLAQLDNYTHLPRWRFPHQLPVSLQLEARVSSADLPGTWGFGFWNDPFSFGFSAGGMSRILPVLPNAAWFFYGSGQNYLSLRDDQPANGFHMKTFQSPLLPSFFSLFAVPVIPLLLWPKAALVLRKLASKIVQEESCVVDCDVTAWHHYHLVLKEDRVSFRIDQQEVFTAQAPQGRMGLVIWIDNQYLNFNSEGRLNFGSLAMQQPGLLSIRHLALMAG